MPDVIPPDVEILKIVHLGENQDLVLAEVGSQGMLAELVELDHKRNSVVTARLI